MVNIWKRIKAWHKNLSTEARFLIAESIFCISLSIVIICIDLSDGRPIEVMTIVFGFLLPMCYKFFTESINILLEQRKNIDDVFEKYKEEIEKKTNAVSKAESKVANITKSKSQSLINKANDVLETAKKTLEIAHNNRQKEVDLAVILPFLMDRISRIKCSSMAAYHRWLDEAFHDYRTTTNGWHNPEYHLSC